MKMTVDRVACIGCGLCVNTCPDAFSLVDDGKAEVFAVPIPDHCLAQANNAKSACPTQAILTVAEG